MANQVPDPQCRILIAGFGAIGKTMCRQAPQSSLISLSRAQNSLAKQHIQADLLHPETLLQIPAIDYVVFTATPDCRTESAYEATYNRALANLLASLSRHQVKRIFFVSSTSVYGQHNGERVDEDSETEATSFSGKIIRQGEQILAHHPIPSTIVRFGGIYGNGRSMLIRHVKAGVDVANKPAPLTNRIHEEDCAGLLLHLIAMDYSGKSLEPCYVAVDNNGADKAAVYQFIAEQMNQPELVNLLPTAPSNLGKRCDNSKMLSTGYQLSYPDYRSGYQQMVEAMAQE
ncbi:NAD(P)-dependent oxidoreductase [Neiella marina]|uniref:NAD(P)-dependent oxidoreductase n=1 Tax=Neiella marina TaxID=508461 RepID=A0A8J2U3I7_9GAMM|nr:NAD-dependent epimerase/dehydratase family protein [Neiella marina]GGA70618.1 NAD(P)-dependent oxidoreductase [Neiella marina]